LEAFLRNLIAVEFWYRMVKRLASEGAIP